MPASAEPPAKVHGSFRRSKAPLKTEKIASKPLVTATVTVEAATAAGGSTATAPSISTASSLSTRTKKKRVKKSISAARRRSVRSVSTSCCSSVSPKKHPQQQQLQASADAVEGLTEAFHSLPSEDANNACDGAYDVTSTSSVSDDSRDGVSRGGSVRHAPEQVTSLAGKRHTRVVMNPPSAACNGGSAPANLAAVAGSSGAAGNRASGASWRRGGLYGATGSAGGANSGNYANDGALRYRTDLDKQVIHFMFERYHQEQICPTADPTLLKDAERAEDSGAGEELSVELNSSGNGRNVKAAGAAAAGQLSSSAPPPCSQPRARRIAVEEIYVPSNGEGDDKNIGLGDWHFFWMHVGRVRHTVCSGDFRWQDQQIINHFPDHAELTRKDLMYKNIKRYLRENQANNYARLTLHTATDWVSAAANAASASSAAVAGGSESAATVSLANPFFGPESSEHVASTKAFCFADSVPITYNIPNDMSMFKEECQKQRGTQWIMKPTARSQGKGIFIIDSARALQRWVKEKKDTENVVSLSTTGPAKRVSCAAGANNAVHSTGSPTSPSTGAAAAAASSSGGPSNPVASLSTTAAGGGGHSSGGLGAYIVSRYISNPLLICGKKFDLRLYVLVTSYRPLVAYLHEDGFARFCATRYNGDSLAQEDLGSHLTNVALQKGDEHYNASHGGKWSFQNLFLYVQCRYGPYAAEGMMKNIQFLIYHSLKAVEPVMFNDKHAFELYGYDILIDDQINPHLIEVNASPSMSTTTPSDRLLKEQVLTDMTKIVFPPGFPANSKSMPYWEYRQRTDLTTQQLTGFKLLQF
ncbi:putative tubulin tyrosine ligase [Leptomonas seymouri]|uniref:Putative tubulin tyrosine ligase n=1 Tax=Leptomonas seymouri TaxID=5684 RepID=A0A0N1PDX5_LEPSE|nr:putative tubulin tyrosine ligase [Leptomonas seymouri]|eukprot:KPI89312.1 putative tubulin tyrosine ligase [Leptomonas seymouri]